MGAQQTIDDLAGFLQDHRRLFVLTGAGISMGSGIPTYRDDNGDWTRSTPVQFRDFSNRHAVRQRYWARSMVGWPAFARARPNLCHTTLMAWERYGRIAHLVTQNVDRLHQAAGSRRVIDLHGRLDQVVCLDCGRRSPRAHLQAELQRLNPKFADLAATLAPDGDADLDGMTFSSVKVPGCTACGGLLKPDVVFFGETVPKPTVDAALAALTGADALLVIGSSLMVYSGFRFCRLAAEADMPLAAISPGRTRADHLLTLKIEARFESVIGGLAEAGFSPGQPDAPRQSSR